MTAAVTAILLGQNPALVFAVENATVKAVRVSAEDVYITTDRPVQYKAFTTENPPRLVLELMNSKLQTLQELPVNGRLLSKVRTGQFQTTPANIARVVMDLTQKTVYEITRKGTELVVTLGGRSGASAPEAVKDSPAAVPAGVKVIVPQAAPSADKPVVMTLEAAPGKPSGTNSGRGPVIAARKKYPGASTSNIMDNLSREPITFDYSEAEVREVIDMLAAKANINVIYSDDVSGTLTISLTKVPFEEAFKTVLNVKGLAAQQVGDNILRIATPATFLAEQRKSMLQTRVFFLNYTKAADLKAQVDAVTASEGRAPHTSIDDTNNALIVTDTPLGLDSTSRLLRNLDRTPKQVMIEVKLVEVNLDDELNLGVDWSFNNGAEGISGQSSFAGPGPKNAGSFTFGKVLGNTRFDAVLAAAATKGKIKVLSDPKVATLNNKEANINITDQTPYDQQTVTIVNGQAVTAHAYSNVTTGITLKVTPSINFDGRISMHLIPSVIQLSAIPNGTAPPPTATRNTDTNVIVKDGETVVLGGLIQDTQNNTVVKVPVLGDIPLLGVLFRKKTNIRTRKELLIFVTPKLIED